MQRSAFDCCFLALAKLILGASFDPDGTHKHKCPKCSHVWEHSNSMAGNEDAHKCPRCSAPQWVRHRD